MASQRHLAILNEGVKTWNQWRLDNPGAVPILSGANLTGMNLRLVDFTGAYLSMTDLTNADLRMATLSMANLTGVNLSGADLSGAYLKFAHLTRAKLSHTKLEEAILGFTTLTGVNLSLARRISSIVHTGPSPIGTDTLHLSKGKIPTEFLRGCGLSPWEIEIARLYDPDLSPGEVDEILGTRIFQKRISGPMFLGGVFISYSHKDADFVEKLEKHLIDEDLTVWRDVHKLVAGDFQRQIFTAIRRQDIIITVLSKNSVDSDWVAAEVAFARKKERAEKRDVLCPLAIDSSWRSRMDDVLWRQLVKKHILDFSDWQEDESFDFQFGTLIKGIKVNYGPAANKKVSKGSEQANGLI